MHAESSVEIGPGTPALEVPWHAEDGSSRYLDLKEQPELLLEIPETRDHFEMAGFLSHVNAKSEMATAKCDVWLSSETDIEDEPFGEPIKCCSYVDVFFDRVFERTDLSAHERLAELIVTKFGRLPEMPASLEIVIRECHFHRLAEPEVSDAGYCLTLYVTGYGEDEIKAHVRWAIALNLLRFAIHQFVHTPGRGGMHPDE